MDKLPWDQLIARKLVKPLTATRIRPNHITAFTLLLTLVGAGLFAPGDPVLANWGAGIFVLGRFLDHFDGELARFQGTTSKIGYYLDYIAGAIGYAALYLALGWGALNSGFGSWVWLLGGGAAVSSIISMFANLAIDQRTGGAESGEAVGYVSWARFELEDGMYLLAPITWIGFVNEFFVLASLGALVYAATTVWSACRPTGKL